MSKFIHSKWEADWNDQTSNKLHSIKPKLQPRKPLRMTRKDCVIFTRLKIGHTNLTHKYHLTREDIPFCVGCNTNFTIKHILTECKDFDDTRKKYYKCKKLKQIFEIVDHQRIIDFLREINLYKKL